MDLSPGAWTRPESGPDLAAARVGMIMADTIDANFVAAFSAKPHRAIEPREGLAVNSQSRPRTALLFAFDTNIIHAYAESHFSQKSA
jgi:hypothetical protein